jgi:hypothetical protein
MIGDSVIATMPDTTTAAANVNANSRNNIPSIRLEIRSARTPSPT